MGCLCNVMFGHVYSGHGVPLLATKRSFKKGNLTDLVFVMQVYHMRYKKPTHTIVRSIDRISLTSLRSLKASFCGQEIWGVLVWLSHRVYTKLCDDTKLTASKKLKIHCFCPHIFQSLNGSFPSALMLYVLDITVHVRFWGILLAGLFYGCACGHLSSDVLQPPSPYHSTSNRCWSINRYRYS